MQFLSSYRIEFYLHKEQVTGARYQLTVSDAQRRVRLSAEVDLTLLEPLDVELKAAEFVDRFIQGDEGLSYKEGLSFGRYLLGKLLADPGLAQMWRDSDQRRKSLGQPLKLELILPKKLVTEVADIPFELLADENGFIFRRSNNAIVRIIQDLPAIDIDLSQNIDIQIAWANTRSLDDDSSLLPSDIFHEVESAIEDACQTTKWTLLPHLRHVSVSKFNENVDKQSSADRLRVLILISHGQAGSIMMHDAVHRDYPRDPGVPVLARDLARLLKKQGYSMIWLLSCHGAQADEWLGSATEALIDPEYGNHIGVIASHGALKAALIAPVMNKLIKSLDETRDIEKALYEARCVLPEAQLQWAAFAYYTREAHKGPSDLPVGSTRHALRGRSPGLSAAAMALMGVVLGLSIWLVSANRTPQPLPQLVAIQDVSSLHDLTPLPARVVGVDRRTGYTAVTIENLPPHVSKLELDDGVWVPERCTGSTCSGLYWSRRQSLIVGSLAATKALNEDEFLSRMREIIGGANEVTSLKIAEVFPANRKLVRLSHEHLLGMARSYAKLNPALKKQEQCKRLSEALRLLGVLKGMERRSSDELSEMEQRVIGDRTSRMCNYIK